MKKGWEVKKLGDVCEVSTGKSNTIDAILDGKYAFFDRSKKIKRSNKFLFDCKAIIIAGEGQTFMPKYFEGKFDLHQRAYALRNFNKEILIEYAFKYLIFNMKYFEEVAVGATAKSLRLRHFTDMKIPIPPLPIQKKIVKILDSAFEEIAKAKKNSELNVENTNRVFANILENIFSDDNLTNSKLKEIANFQYGYTAKSNYSGYFRYVRITDISKEGLLKEENKVYVPKFKESGKYILNQNDLLMARTGASYGDVLLYSEHDPSIFASYLIRISFKINIKPKLYWFFSKSSKYWNQAKKLSSGSAQPHFNGKALGEVTFSYPESEQKQKVMIEKIQKLNNEIKHLKSNYTKKQNLLEELKQSILHKAFNGDLTEVSA